MNITQFSSFINTLQFYASSFLGSRIAYSIHLSYDDFTRLPAHNIFHIFANFTISNVILELNQNFELNEQQFVLTELVTNIITRYVVYPYYVYTQCIALKKSIFELKKAFR